MDWIKVTPDTMPPDDKPVFITVKFKCDGIVGVKRVFSDVCWCKEAGVWANWADAEVMEEDIFTITHWMPYPAPAED